MTQQSSSLSSRIGLRPWLVLIVLMIGQPLTHSAVAQHRKQPLTTDQILNQIRKAHIVARIPKDTFNSLLLSGCMQIAQNVVPKAAAQANSNCIEEETGVLIPAHAYVSVAIGPTRITDLIDSGTGKGWQLIEPTTFNGTNPTRTVTPLQKMKYDALEENTKHSLPALLAVLQRSEKSNNESLEVTSEPDAIVVKWRTERSLNELIFNPTSFLCEKQVRTVGGDQSITKFSNYRRVSNVMLPHTIIAAKVDGTIIATREIKRWTLGLRWPSDHFQPETIQFNRN